MFVSGKRLAGVAQLVEQLPCKQQVAGSNPTASSRSRGIHGWLRISGGMPERPKGADCKSAGSRLRRFESFSLHHRRETERTTSAGIAQLVERQPSKLNVTGSNPVSRSNRRARSKNENTKG